MCYPTQDYTIIEFMINIKAGIVGVGGILAIISYHIYPYDSIWHTMTYYAMLWQNIEYNTCSFDSIIAIISYHIFG